MRLRARAGPMHSEAGVGDATSAGPGRRTAPARERTGTVKRAAALMPEDQRFTLPSPGVGPQQFPLQ